MNQMSKMDFFKQRIVRIAKKHKIKKVIIDIRENLGGNDSVWLTTLQSIIKQPLITNTNLVVKNTEIVKKYLCLTDKNTKFFSSSFLKNEDFIKIESGAEIIKPSSNSIAYDGKIFILQNDLVFSSAGALSALASYSDKLISVGSSSGFIGGLGISPFYFMLPNSKLIFAINASLDLTNAINAEDVFNKTEVPVDLKIEDYRNYFTKSFRKFSRRFLYKKDPVFRKALELN